MNLFFLFLFWFWFLFLLPGLLCAQATSSINSEKLPTTRDPSYVAPLVSEELRLGQESQAALAIFGQGEGLSTFLKSRRESKLQEKRETNRFREREDERMVRQGYKQALLEEILQEDFGMARFPKNMGRYPYRESGTRRFSVVFLLALPITGGLSFGALAAYKSISRGDPGFNNTESIVAGLISIGAAIGIAVYDYKRVLQLQKVQEAWPPPLKTRNGMIEEQESDLPASEQSLLFRLHLNSQNHFAQNKFTQEFSKEFTKEGYTTVFSFRFNL